VLAALTDRCIRRPLTAWVLMVAVSLVGLLTLHRIGLSQFPDVDKPQISVIAELPGAPPKSMERDVCELLEEVLVQAEGVASIDSNVTSGRAVISMHLEPNRDVEAALQDAQNRISRIADDLPRDMLPIHLSKNNPEDRPLVFLALSGPYSAQRLSDTAHNTITDALQAVPGVGSIDLQGPQTRAVKVWLYRDRLEARDLTVADVIAGLTANNLEASGGTVEGAGGDLGVRVLGQPQAFAELANVVIATRPVPGGAPATVRLGDLAMIEDGFVEERRINRVDRQPRQGIAVSKQRGANAVAVATGVRAVVERLNAQLPQGMVLEVAYDGSQFILQSISAMWHELACAVVLTTLVCWIFLGAWWAAASVLLAIPMALLGTVTALWGWGATLNTFTLLGLSLAIGLVVDDAIMVQESIDRHRGLGLSPRKAAARGTAAVRFAALAASVAVLAVFSPVLFIKGEIGASFLQFGLALCFAVALSYVEAVTLAPARAAQFMGASREPHEPRVWQSVESGYGRLLSGVLRRPWLTLASASLAMVGGAWALSALPRETSPDQDAGRIEVPWSAPATADQPLIDRIADRMSSDLGAVPGVASVQVFANGVRGFCWVTLAPSGQRAPQSEILTEVRRRLALIPGLSARARPSVQDLIQVPDAAAADISIRGPEHERCAEIADEILQRWRNDPHLVEASTSWTIAAAELAVEPDRAACADLGVDVKAMATTIDGLIGGAGAGTFTLDGRRQDVRVRLRLAERSTPEDIGLIRIRTRSGETVPLSAVAHVRIRPAPAQLTRRDREPTVFLRANAAPGVSQEEAQRAAAQLVGTLPPGYRAVPGDSAAVFKQAVSDLGFALVVGLIAAYLVLVIQFDSLVHPLTVLTALPLAAAGAGAALLVTGQSLNLYSGIGLLLLMGLAKKNSILLVDRANLARERDGAHDAASAMRIAGPARLRAILMTSVATCAAAVPIAIGFGDGAEVRRPMAIAIIGGVAVSTALSLVVVPAFYVLCDRVGRRRDREMPPNADEADGEAAAAG
jgi:hydrophobe/amphiphile efflux-1 (HAE1) family protein